MDRGGNVRRSKLIYPNKQINYKTHKFTHIILYTKRAAYGTYTGEKIYTYTIMYMSQFKLTYHRPYNRIIVSLAEKIITTFLRSIMRITYFSVLLLELT